MKSYYAATARIRYYGQIPEKVGKTADAVWMTGIESSAFGENVISTDWRTSLENASPVALDLSRRTETAHEALANMTVSLDSLYAFTKKWGPLDANVEPASGRVVTKMSHARTFQDLLQKAWRADPEALGEVSKGLKARVDVSESGIDIAVLDLRTLICLLFLRDYHARRTKVCGNPDCDSPFFVQQRRGQKYCTHKCAVLMNVRRFREREVKAKAHIKRRAQR